MYTKLISESQLDWHSWVL